MSLDERYNRLLAQSGFLSRSRGTIHRLAEEGSKASESVPRGRVLLPISALEPFLLKTLGLKEEDLKAKDFTREKANALFEKYQKEVDEGKHVPPGSVVTPKSKKEIKKTDKAVVEVSSKVSSQIAELEKKKEELKTQLAETREALNALDYQITEVEDSPDDSPSRASLTKREAVADAYASSIDVLRASIDSIIATINGLKSTKDAVGVTTLSLFSSDGEMVGLFPGEDASSSLMGDEDEDDDVPEGDFEDLEGYNEELEDLLSRKKDLLESLYDWTSSLTAATRKISKLMNKRFSLVRRLSLSSGDVMPVISKLSELDAEIVSTSALIGRINNARKSMERDLQSVKVDLSILLSTWSSSIESFMPDPEERTNSEIEDTQEFMDEVESSSPSSRLVEDNAAVFDYASNSYSSFVYKSLASQVPSDGKLDEKVATLANKVIKLSEKMADLASGFSYNVVHRSTLRLVPGLYYIIAHALLSGIGREPEAIVQASLEVTALCEDLEAAGLIKEAGILRDSFDFILTKNKDLVNKAKDLIDRYQFMSEDTGKRRLTPKEIAVKKQRYYAQMQKVLWGITKQVSDLKLLEKKYKKEGDPEGKAPSAHEIMALEAQRDQIAKQMEEMEGDTGGAFPKSPKSLEQLASVVISSTAEPIEKAVRAGTPHSPKLEVEVLRLARKLSTLAQGFPKISGRSRTLKEYPTFHSAMMALHIMFVGLEDILTAALRRT